jgi:hypothetical protein
LLGLWAISFGRGTKNLKKRSKEWRKERRKPRMELEMPRERR